MKSIFKNYGIFNQILINLYLWNIW